MEPSDRRRSPAASCAPRPRRGSFEASKFGFVGAAVKRGFRVSGFWGVFGGVGVLKVSVALHALQSPVLDLLSHLRVSVRFRECSVTWELQPRGIFCLNSPRGQLLVTFARRTNWSSWSPSQWETVLCSVAKIDPPRHVGSCMCVVVRQHSMMQAILTWRNIDTRRGRGMHAFIQLRVTNLTCIHSYIHTYIHTYHTYIHT